MSERVLTEAQKDALAVLNEHSEWRDADNKSYDWIATEHRTGDPVIYVYERHAPYVLRPDGSWEVSE